MRTLIIGDIHGGLKALNQVLERATVTEEDKLIFLGDYVDGWSESSGVVKRLILLQNTNDCVFIRGNHDQWCQDWLSKSQADATWLQHGGRATIESYDKISLAERKKHLEFFESMQEYYVDNQNYLYVHAGFSSMHGVGREPFKTNYSWDRTLWEMALVMRETNLAEDSPFFPKRLTHYKNIFIGHTPTTNYGMSEPIKASKVINVDTGAAFKGRLTIYDLESDEFWQSDALPSLYPNEKGRN